MREEVHRITDAARPRSLSIWSCQRRYLLAIVVRTGCFLAMVMIPGPTWLRVAFAVGAILLPYVAVIGANALPDTTEELPRFEQIIPPRAELPSGRAV